MANPLIPGEDKVHPRAAFQSRDFCFFQLMRFLALVGVQMQWVVVGFHVYTLTKSPLNLGYIGLSMFLPQFIFPLLAGHVADRFDRRRVIIACELGMLCCTLMLIALTLYGLHGVWPIYGVLFLIATCRTFLSPAATALLPRLVPVQHFANAVTWHSSIFHLSTTFGPLIAGVIYGWTAHVFGAPHPEIVYACSALLNVVALFMIVRVNGQGVPGSAAVAAPSREKMSFQTLIAGVKYIFSRPVVLGAISLDLFAVLLGGATALMPIFALDILNAGATGLGKLEASQSIGALLMGLVFAHLPPLRRAGVVMLCCVAGFGLATIGFGLSRSFALSMVILAGVGALDMVSVIIRQSMIQLRTPDSMRGRVTAVNMIFVGASNQLGEFESGVTAHLWGPVPAVVIGGLGTLLVVAIWTVFFPELRKFGRLDAEHNDPPHQKSAA